MGWGSSCHHCIHMASFPPTLPLHMQLTSFPTTIAMLHLSCSFRPTSPSSMIMFTQQVTSLHAYSQDFLPPLSCFAYLAQCDHHHLTSSIIITQLPPVPCFVYHGQPYHHPSFLYHVLMCATTRAKIKIPFCCSSSFPLRYGLRRSWGGFGASWGGRAILRRLDAVLGPRTSSCLQKWPSWSILGQS